jgi:hypothetical protein
LAATAGAQTDEPIGGVVPDVTAAPSGSVERSVSSTATVTEIHQGLEGAVKAEMEATARSAVAETFELLAVPAPLAVEATADADFDLTPVAPHLTDVRVTVRVHLSEGRPGDEMRRARAALATRLRAKGWRVDGIGDESAPNVTLLVEPVLAEAGLALPKDTRPYLVLAALAVAALCASILALWMLARGWRAFRRPRSRASSLAPAPKAELPSLPTVMQTAPALSGPALAGLAAPTPAAPELRPVSSAPSPEGPSVSALQGPSVSMSDAQSATSRQGAAAKLPEIDVSSLERPNAAATPEIPAGDFAALRRKIAAMPLDKAIEALAALDPTTRRHIIGTLDLKEPVRRRLERELI